MYHWTSHHTSHYHCPPPSESITKDTKTTTKLIVKPKHKHPHSTQRKILISQTSKPNYRTNNKKNKKTPHNRVKKEKRERPTTSSGGFIGVLHPTTNLNCKNKLNHQQFSISTLPPPISTHKQQPISTPPPHPPKKSHNHNERGTIERRDV